ncbi:amino acid ABC transporter substrate-binding protein [Aestuariibacter sp. AA17]|uniref:Amino acid ABC transporter substrate-binding protein n=1 Tax=Fluctibacter corallii TaxID=2984329 RepID=A0ABT3AAF3_9ALTE|nr:amino acid ABC transporter substrate-binding protein [Aestuariibacter sp. AA17]MCV2885613.1 amino acid ABC transporter substrate-binding protein [Aestuariibacter sp. AA17]
MMRITLIWLIAASFFSCAAYSATWNIIYPRPLTENDQRTRYPVQLLKTALEHTGVKYKLSPSDRILLQRKALKLLGENRGLHVVWSMTDKPRESQLLPIRIPIYKGLIGWRLLLANETQLPKLANITSPEQLMQHRVIQGHDWPDTKILQSNGFEVVTSKTYLGLFSLLEKYPTNVFPRSVIEVWSELETESIAPTTQVVPNIGIQYPSAVYFFVNKRNITLAKLIQNGLEKAIESGKFDALFNETYAPILERSNMANRQFFKLDNTSLPEETPIDRDELWFSPK